jgi:RNA polymerase sigma factor (sigma-70 family)
MIDQETLVRALLTERVKMLGYIQSLIRRHDLAEDIFQDVCAASMKKRDQIEDEVHLRNWLRTAARRQVMNVLRKRQEHHLSLDQDVIDLLDPAWSSHDNSDSAARADALRACLGLLSESHRDLVRKRFAEDYDYERLAAEIKRTVNSLYVTFSRIYATLGKCISARLESGGTPGNGGRLA